MNLDIVFVTYNSEKWVKNCIESILKSEFDLQKISLLFCDNNSSDKTYNILKNYQEQYQSTFNKFLINQSNKNLGFGKGNNCAAKLGNSEYILFLNIDTEIEVDTLSKLEYELDNSYSEIGAWELRQKPYEHPKFFDPYTGYTSWASGACLIVRRDLFTKIHGFDSMLFMYAEDVEISWKIRKNGYKIKYLPHIPITHYSYETPNAFKETQYIYSLINNLYLRYKYGSFKEMIKGNLLVGKRMFRNYLSPIVTPEEDKKIRKKIKHEYIKVQFKGIIAICSNLFSRKAADFQPQFILGFDYEQAKLDPFYIIDNLKQDGPLVSVIVRTCNRPNTLRETLISIRNQHYRNIEVVIVEDGENHSQNMIEKEFSDLNYQYISLGKQTGRSHAGNVGLKAAKGEYLNFLDDDDLFYPEHILVLINEILQSNVKIAYSTAFETSIIVHKRDPYEYEIKNINIVHKGKFNRMRLFTRNITPIQCVMFHKEVFEKCGGFDESIEALEDWDLWIRFALSYKWKYVEKTTSLYRVPYKRIESRERDKFLISTLDYVVNKYENQQLELTVKDIYDLVN